MITKHKDAVYRQMVRVCGDHEDAGDVLVEALLSAHRSAASLRSEDTFRAWVATIGRRICSKLRKRQAMESLVSIAEREIPDLGADDESSLVATIDAETCVKNLLSGMPPTLLEAYRLDLAGYSAEDAAAKLNLSVAATKSRLHRARAYVRQQLDDGLVPSCT